MDGHDLVDVFEFFKGQPLFHFCVPVVQVSPSLDD